MFEIPEELAKKGGPCPIPPTYTKSLSYADVSSVFYLEEGILFRHRTHCPASLHVDKFGYLTTHFKQSPSKVHRLLYTLYHQTSPDGWLVDHIDGNRQNNSKENLRLCTYEENSRHYSKQRTSKNKYKGVSKEQGKWRARIRTGVERFNIGTFDTEEEAALAYNVAAAHFFKEFACLNNIGERARRV